MDNSGTSAAAGEPATAPDPAAAADPVAVPGSGVAPGEATVATSGAPATATNTTATNTTATNTAATNTAATVVAPATRLSRLLVLVFAVASGAAVGNLYYAQPLLDMIAGDLRIGQGPAGLLVTATQVGYALGIMFIVPLGDVRNRRRMVPLMMGLSALSLAACAAAPGFVVLLCSLVAVGLTTVAGQILIPFAGDLADDSSRGKVVGIVVSGALTGILVARIVSGFIAGVAGWRVVFLCAAVLMLGLSVTLYRAIPAAPAKTAQPYRALLRSVLVLVRREPTLRLAMCY
ncbi:MAG: hypothetical protein QOD04_3125, partial [Pseudonocardiales bacterium]|nr:hypothetical protein [Pseudonocardiales bacterium]